MLGATWSAYGDDLYAKMQDLLWSEELQFWIDVVEGTNLQCQGRELIGYFPYRFGVGTSEMYIKGLEAGINTEHFITEYGPTTLEQTNPYYTALKNTTYCCQWQGQSWPFSTSVWLSMLAQLARTNASTVATPLVFQEALRTYAATNYKDGVPYTAESHYPTIDMWSGDTTNHSENYFHSTYADNIFTNLIGITPTLDDQLILQPLIPSNWSHFAVENLPYHGSLISIIWDSTGSCYSGNHSAGLSIYSNGTLLHNQEALSAVNVTLNFDSQAAASQLDSAPEWQNILANTNSPWGLPSITADYTFSSNGDISSYEAYKLNDGLLWYDTTPDNRWTNNQSTSPYNSLYVTLPRARNMSSVSLAVFVDTDRGGVIACPAGYKIIDSNNQTIAFSSNWTECVPNALNTILFDSPSPNSDNATTPAAGVEIESDKLQITLNAQQDYAVAIGEVQIWVPPVTGPRWETEDGLIGTFIGGFSGRGTGLNGTVIDGGVEIGPGGWVEVAGVRTADGKAATANLTIVGGMSGTVEVGVNYLTNHTVSFDGTNADKTVEVDLLLGANTITMFQTAGSPWIDALVVG